jgi:hypothetical protein
MKIVRLLEKRRFEEAIRRLEKKLRREESGRVRALLGTAHFLNENYAAAERELARALGEDPHHAEAPEWARKHALARANAGARVDQDDPPVLPFIAEELLATPDEDGANLPETVNPAPPDSLVDQACAKLGEWGGKGIDLVWSHLGKVAKKHHRAREGIWTDWYRHGVYPGLAILAGMRDDLDANNLVDTYPPGARTGFMPEGLAPPPGVHFFRTPDGAWNNLQNPKEGAAGVRFPRNVLRARTYQDPRLQEPNPARISKELFTRVNGMQEVPFLNLLAGAWIQFMVHDWVSHRTASLPRGEGPRSRQEAFPVELPEDHPARALYHQRKMWIAKTLDDPTRNGADLGTPPTTINEVTSWWDASQLYGSDVKKQLCLRSLVDGKLRVDAQGHLFLDEAGIAKTGYSRNWWVGLALLHTVFVREHNAICDELKRTHPTWGDDRLFNVARLVNAAVLAKIHSVEWTPAILPNPCLSRALNANWYGLLEQWLHRPGQRRVLRHIKLRSPVMGGLVGNATEKFGKPYGLSEEFTEVYRLHELLPDLLALRSAATGKSLGSVALPETRMRLAADVMGRFGMVDLLFSFGKQAAGQIVLNNYPRALQEISVPGNPVLDLGAVDILRARERGVPRYNEFRRRLGLNPIKDFDDLTDDRAVIDKLRSIYLDDVELIDMQVGTRAEKWRPAGFGFGETLFQIFILNASRRLQADRFFTENYDERTYTREGLDWIDRATMKSVLIRHFPELERTALANIDNAFEPWDVGALTRERHPLRYVGEAPRWLRSPGERVEWA